MRPELDALVTATLEGDDPSSWVLKHLLDYCVDLEAQSPERWAGQRTERSSPGPGSANTMPELMYFLPTPAEFEEVKRRFRLSLTQDGRLNVAVMRALYRAADHSVLFPLVDVLQGYDGDPSRYDEVAAAMNILPFATADAPDAGSARARRALEHVRDIGADIVSQGYSLRYWANNSLVEFGDDEGDSQMDEEHPLPEGLVELKAVSEAVLSELFAARTADVVVAVDKLDEQCASHLHGWSALGEGGGHHGHPFCCGERHVGRDQRGLQPVHGTALGYVGLPLGARQLAEAFRGHRRGQVAKARPGPGPCQR
jgi:hypothetical protein